MAVVYHAVPANMVGNVIYPLSMLKTIDDSAYEFQKSKYRGRESALDFPIPGIEVLFNDAVHCAALNPKLLFKARRAMGFGGAGQHESSWVTGFFYAIPLERILVNPVVWYSCKTLWINGAPDEAVPLSAPRDEFEPFDQARYHELAEPTPAHMAYLASMKERGRRPLMFVHIPHVLVAGPIDVGGLQPIPWDEASTKPAIDLTDDDHVPPVTECGFDDSDP